MIKKYFQGWKAQQPKEDPRCFLEALAVSTIVFVPLIFALITY